MVLVELDTTLDKTADPVLKALRKTSSERTDDDLQTIQKATADVKFFQRLSPEEHRELCRVLQPVFFPKDTAIFEQGDVGTSIYVIYHGAAKVYVKAGAAAKEPCTLSACQINSLIDERVRARASANYALADELLAQLNGASVHVDDSSKTWSTPVNADGTPGLSGTQTVLSPTGAARRRGSVLQALEAESRREGEVHEPSTRKLSEQAATSTKLDSIEPNVDGDESKDPSFRVRKPSWLSTLESQREKASEEGKANEEGKASEHGKERRRSSDVSEFVRKLRLKVANQNQLGPCVCVLEDGDSFGELALMGSGIRQASVRTTMPTHLLKIDKEVYDRSLHELHEAELERQIKFVRSIFVFANWSEEDLRGISKVMTKRQYEKNTTIIAQVGRFA